MKKIELGQFFTKKDIWLKPQIKDFIINSNQTTAFDPFAGSGDLLNVAKDLGFTSTIGLDIDTTLQWQINDSLKHIPSYPNAIIITNPPYLAKQSASRKNINLSHYFNKTSYNDIYLIALDEMLKAQKYVVAIIPESFINSNYQQKSLLSSITILEENPFTDTDCPVCVACFDSIPKPLSEVKIYKNTQYINTLQNIERLRLSPSNNINIIFNDKQGWLGLRAIDSTNDKNFIQFSHKNEINYDFANRIKESSRHITLININIPENKKQALINASNELINKLRQDSADILLTPFKGNTKKGTRRRRLDFRLARAILEKSYQSIMKDTPNEQFNLF
ncbi:MAG: hypothetical protein IKW58_01885 [Alphaproteobacteria bacterium]|nr:hypothetical protein [Alphaproteobacteria bacterium]